MKKRKEKYKRPGSIVQYINAKYLRKYYPNNYDMLAKVCCSRSEFDKYDAHRVLDWRFMFTIEAFIFRLEEFCMVTRTAEKIYRINSDLQFALSKMCLT